MRCPSCNVESTGRFCSSCGARLDLAACADCGAKLVPGAAWCTQCGSAVNRAAGSTGNALPWYVAGGMLVLLLAILIGPRLAGPNATANPTPAVALPGQGTPPPLTGTPREQADRLFNRIMVARDRDDMGEARRFTPMAVQAYAMAEPLDDDGLFHLATVHIVAGDPTAARATAERILARNANHLLGLAVAAEAAELAGDQNAARTFHRRFLDAYDVEIARDLPEYLDHARVFPTYSDAARRATGG